MTARLRKQMALVQSGSIITQPFNVYLATVPEPAHIDVNDHKMMMRLTLLLTRKPSNNRSGAFHPSGIDRCPREQVFSFLGVPQKERINPGLQHVFSDGHWRHVRWQIALLQAGLVSHVEEGIKSTPLRLAGHIDALQRDEYLVELKGIHTMQFKYVLTEPKPEHSDQAELYLRMAGYDTMCIIYEDKASNNWHEHVVHPDKQRWLRLKRLVATLNAAIDNRRLPPMLDDCRVRKGAQFRDCPYAYVCHRADFESAEAAAQEATPEEALAVVVSQRPVRLRVRKGTGRA